MKVSDIVSNRIDRFKSGYVFTYNDFSIPVDKVNALKKVLSRLVSSGKIIRLSKGKYYKPKEGIIGKLKPDEYQIVKDLLEDEGKLIGYLSGISAFNKLGLTTQVSNTIQVGTNIDKKSIKRGKYTIRFIRQRNTINKDNIFLLQILDSIRFIKRIPDANINVSCERLKNIIQDLPDFDQDYMLKLAMKYNPATRALTGAMLELIKGEAYVALLYSTLRVTTTFDLNISEETLKNKDKWQIR
jgi:hypothetical protein